MSTQGTTPVTTRIAARGWFGLYVLAIIAANWLTSRLGLVPVGFGLSVTAGTFAAGAALLARDFVQASGGVRLSLVAIALGTAASWFLADPYIALASAVAFAGAETLDLLVFTPLRRRSGFGVAALVSNTVSAPIDTILFLWIAGFAVTLQAVTGQFIGKVLWATLLPLTIYFGVRRAVLRESVHTEGA